MASVTFLGAARRVTGAMYLIEAAGARLLLDAGRFEGPGAEARELNAGLGFDPRRLDGVIVSHAHLDHTGRLPLLVARGFHGPVYATPATRTLSAVLLPDAARAEEEDRDLLAKLEGAGPGAAAAEPLYAPADAIAVQDLTIGVPYRRLVHLRKHLTVEFTRAGHILGAASVDIRLSEPAPHRIVYSGDIGRAGQPLAGDPAPPAGPVDTLMVEATYADRDHESPADAERRLGEVVRQVAARGGKLLVPAHPLGRAQELVFGLHRLRRAGSIPEIPIYIDSPVAVDLAAVLRLHPDTDAVRECLATDRDSAFDLPLVRYVRHAAESERLSEAPGPAVIVAGSGTVEAGRILRHLEKLLGDNRACVLLLGFQAEDTRGRRLADGADRVSLFGREHERRAEVVALSGYSGHADRTELRAWVRALGGPVRRAFVVHGEPPALEAMAEILREEGVTEVVIPNQGERYDL